MKGKHDEPNRVLRRACRARNASLPDGCGRAKTQGKWKDATFNTISREVVSPPPPVFCTWQDAVFV